MYQIYSSLREWFILEVLFIYLVNWSDLERFLQYIVSALFNRWTNLTTGTYYFTKKTTDRYEGGNLCNSLGGHLIEIGSQEEQETVGGYLKTKRILGSKTFWMGLNDVKKKGEWVWHKSQPAKYTNWYGGQPGSPGSPPPIPDRREKGRDCVRLTKAKGGIWSLQWYYDYCSGKLNSVCEKGKLCANNIFSSSPYIRSGQRKKSTQINGNNR